MNWFLLGLVWLAASLAFTLGWAAVISAERRYCAHCSDPHGSHQLAGHDHAHTWHSARRAVR